MPRNHGKKGSKDDDDFVVEVKPKKKDIYQPDVENFIEQLLKDQCYWVRKGHKLHCSLCSVNVQFSSFIVLKTEISSHIRSKRHKKKFELCNLEKDCIKFPEVSKLTSKDDEENISDKEENRKISNIVNIAGCHSSTQVKEENKKLSDIINEVGYHLSHGVESSSKSCKKLNSNKNQLIDFETVYLSLDKNDPVTKVSKKYIVKAKDGNNYFCTICQAIIFESLIANEFRYNLWIHINNESHRERLPNFSKAETDFEKLIQKVSRKIPSNLKDDLTYFKIGPVFHFVRCSLCNVAVSDNFHRLQNHIAGKSHQNRKMTGFIEYSNRSMNKYTSNWYSRIILGMESEFENYNLNEDMKFIHIGSMPGYVLCSLCSQIVLPTFHYMKEHFESDNHVNNKTANLINWESTHKTNQIEKLQNNFFSLDLCHGAFEETKYGIKCHPCQCIIPPTSYALYCHVMKNQCISKE